MSAQMIVNVSDLVECECGNMTHPDMDMCGECLQYEDVFTTRNIKAHAQARRFLINGN